MKRICISLLVAFGLFAACSNDANAGEYNEGIGREGQRNNIESVDNTKDTTDASMTKAPHYSNEDTAQMQRKIRSDKLPDK